MGALAPPGERLDCRRREAQGRLPRPLGTGPRPGRRGLRAGDALRHSVDLVQDAERLGYRRHWVAEHHNMPGIASSSPAVLLAHLAAATSTIRLGSGGLMLPNHAPLVVVEQFGMLEALHPGRIDLGIGRAPGTDPVTAQALRRNGDAHRRRLPRAARASSSPSSRARSRTAIPTEHHRGSGPRLPPRHLAPRLEHLQRATPRVCSGCPSRSRTTSAPAEHAAGARRVPVGVPAVRAAGASSCDARCLRGVRRDRRACSLAGGAGRARRSCGSGQGARTCTRHPRRPPNTTSRPPSATS